MHVSIDAFMMNERRESGGVVRDATFNGGKHKFTNMKVPMQCPLVLLVKAD
jgi:hypothetical protein